MSSGPLLTHVVKQPLRHILPDRVSAIETDCIDHLNFHCALAPAAGDAQYMTLDVP
jgi:hypothetical protein